MHQHVEMTKGGLWRELLLVSRLAQHGHQPAQLRHGAPTCRLDREQRFAGLFRLPVQCLPSRACLQHHQADAVRHDVVQLTGDSRALVGDGGLDLLLLLGLQLGRAGLEAVPTQSTAAQRLAKGPRDRIEHPLSGRLIEAAWQR